MQKLVFLFLLSFPSILCATLFNGTWIVGDFVDQKGNFGVYVLDSTTAKLNTTFVLEPAQKSQYYGFCFVNWVGYVILGNSDNDMWILILDLKTNTIMSRSPHFSLPGTPVKEMIRCDTDWSMPVLPVYNSDKTALYFFVVDVQTAAVSKLATLKSSFPIETILGGFAYDSSTHSYFLQTTNAKKQFIAIANLWNSTSSVHSLVFGSGTFTNMVAMSGTRIIGLNVTTVRSITFSNLAFWDLRLNGFAQRGTILSTKFKLYSLPGALNRGRNTYYTLGTSPSNQLLLLSYSTLTGQVQTIEVERGNKVIVPNIYMGFMDLNPL